MRGSSIALEDYTLEECIRIFRDAGFATVEMSRAHLKRCRTEQLTRNFVAYARSMGISMGGLNVVGEPSTLRKRSAIGGDIKGPGGRRGSCVFTWNA